MCFLHPCTTEGVGKFGILQTEEGAIVVVACTHGTSVGYGCPARQWQGACIAAHFVEASFIEGYMHLAIEGWEVHLAGYVGYTIELNGEAQSLPLHTHCGTVGILRDGRILIRCQVVGINLTVAIEIHNLIVACHLAAVLFREGWTCIEIIPTADIAIVYIGTNLLDGITGILSVSWSQVWVISKLNLVGCVGHVEVCPGAEVLVPALVHLQGKFVTLTINNTQIGNRCAGSEISRNGSVLNQNIGTVIFEDVERTGNQTAQESEVETEVLLLCGLPMQVWITYLALSVDGVRRIALVGTHQPSCSTIGIFVSILESVGLAKVVITDASPGSTYLQHIHVFLDLLHERLFGNHPSQGC